VGWCRTWGGAGTWQQEGRGDEAKCGYSRREDDGWFGWDDVHNRLVIIGDGACTIRRG
jgi:hypothetical protein